MIAKIPWLYSLFMLGSMVMAQAQTGGISGKVSAINGEAIPSATVLIPPLNRGTLTDSSGYFEIKGIPVGSFRLRVTALGYEPYETAIKMGEGMITQHIRLEAVSSAMEEVVITGTLKEVSRKDSPIPVEIITSRLFCKNPTPGLFEAVGMVNGVKPQLNCNVCNTGDIHINGMEGSYTMILIDGMPIVSALSTVYGLSGIPNSIVDRIEVVKGPASSLYGSEAMGGIINVITRKPETAPPISIDMFGTSWRELNADGSVKYKTRGFSGLLGVNYFNYGSPSDKNNDNFTDLTLQNRISLFNKWQFSRHNNRLASMAARYVYEDRWGGEMNWNKLWRGTDSIYGESIYTKRAELIGLYQLPIKEKVFMQLSYNWHNQDSWYGTTPYLATQQVGFVQLYWDKQAGKKHSVLAGTSLRYTVYDDNTPATASFSGDQNEPARTLLPGIFVQDEWAITEKHKLLTGYRYDYNRLHGSVHSPRLAYRFSPVKNHTLRASLGTGFRVVNLFTEDHAALTGAREIVIKSALNPEKSYNGNLNYTFNTVSHAWLLGFDLTAFYSYFTNKIIADFDTEPLKIIYDNLKGHAVSRGVSLNTDLVFRFPLKILAGVTYMDVFQVSEDGQGNQEKNRQLHAPEWSGTLVVTSDIPGKLTIDLTGNWNGPMRLPVLPNDYRPAYSPWFGIANIQLTKPFANGLSVYGGVKNLFNFVPKHPIMRPFDPFNKYADDPQSNPMGYRFDPSYNYASLQGIRIFTGVRYIWSRKQNF